MKATAVIRKADPVSADVNRPSGMSATIAKMGGAAVVVDPALDPTSSNPVENKAIVESIETISGNVTSLATEVDGKQNKLYYIVNGERYPVIRLIKTTAQGVSGILLEYDDGTAAGGEVFFADGNGLNTVLNAVNASIATKADASAIPTATSQLTNDSGYISGISGNDVKTALGYTPYNATNPNGYVNATQAANAAPVQSVNGQTGAVSLSIPTVPSNVSAFTNDAGYVTASTAPVRSVNGQTGAVTLSIPTVPSNVSAFTNDAGYITLADLPIYNGGVS